jgi:YidC/Oxa1 family membrane protein insertase
MEQRRFVLFVSLSLLIWLGWINFVIPKFFPPEPKKARPAAAAQLQELEDRPADALWPANALLPEKIVQAEAGLPQHPPETVRLGSPDPNSGFFLNVQLTSLGGAIEFIELNDPRYPDFNDRTAALKVVGSDPQSPALTFATEIPALDKQLPPGGNQNLHWEVMRETLTDSVAEFRLVAPDGGLEVVKRYDLKKPDAQAAAQPKARDQSFEGYELVLTVRLRNLLAQEQEIEYVLQGPVNLPLEDAANSSKYRDVRMGFVEPDGSIHRGQLSAAEVADHALANKQEIWKKPLKYLGVDVKYFAGLIVPQGDQVQAPNVVASAAQLVAADPDKKLSDISVLLTAKAELAPHAEVEQQFLLYTGPKRQELLRGVSAEAIVDFGYVDVIARSMLWLLNLFHSLGANYGVAIILLTVVVRLAMFPVSRHQAHNMQRMKELQPQIKELQQKYANNKEELGRAQMELFRKHNYNPLSGCLPLLLQLPISPRPMRCSRCRSWYRGSAGPISTCCRSCRRV